MYKVHCKTWHKQHNRGKNNPIMAQARRVIYTLTMLCKSLSAPAVSSSRTIASWPFKAANINAVPLSWSMLECGTICQTAASFSLSLSLSLSHTHTHINTCLIQLFRTPYFASTRGLTLTLSFKVLSTPASRSSWAIPSWPVEAARISAVVPFCN